MFKKLAVVLLVALAGLAGFIASRPSDFRISRSRTLSVPPDVVYAHVSDFAQWPLWSPWEKLDPSMKKEITGAPGTTGASYHWVGNDEVGEGRMTITDTRPPQSLTLRLEFIKPFAATNTTQFDFTPSGPGTNVTWAMSGTNNFLMKAFGLFMDMDKMVGADFEKGLAALDTLTAAEARRAAESAPAPSAAPTP